MMTLTSGKGHSISAYSVESSVFFNLDNKERIRKDRRTHSALSPSRMDGER